MPERLVSGVRKALLEIPIRLKNLDLVQELYALPHATPRIELRWIRAHEGTRWNEYADALAGLPG